MSNQVKVNVVYLIRTPEDVLKHNLNDASLDGFSLNPFFSEGGYWYKVRDDAMYVISEYLIDDDGRVKIYIEN